MSDECRICEAYKELTIVLDKFEHLAEIMADYISLNEILGPENPEREKESIDDMKKRYLAASIEVRNARAKLGHVSTVARGNAYFG